MSFLLRRSIIPLVSASVILASCGGGGGSSGNTARPPAPPPPDSPPDLAVENAYPALSFSQPVSLRQAPADSSRWYVAEKQGVVRVFDNDPGVAAAEVFLDISGRVDASRSESGLLGMAFHPAYPSVPEVFLSYTATGAPLVSRVSRFRLDGSGRSLDPSSEEIILELAQPRSNHNGGDLAFGPTGFFYASFGDGGGVGDPDENAQDTSSLFGTILRIDIDVGLSYGIPPDNPFAAGDRCGEAAGGAPCAEIFAWGFRNPWRMSFDAATGRLWVGDVGQGDWEEIDRVVAGGNYGWNDREGAHCFDPPSDCATGFEEPVTEYDLGAGQSVTGGFVYRGSNVPDLAGWYVFGDFVSGALFAVLADAQPTVAAEQVGDSGLNISTFAVDNDGELYVVDFGGGTIHRIVTAP